MLCAQGYSMQRGMCAVETIRNELIKRAALSQEGFLFPTYNSLRFIDFCHYDYTHNEQYKKDYSCRGDAASLF